MLCDSYVSVENRIYNEFIMLRTAFYNEFINKCREPHI